VPHLATCIFLYFYNEPELGVEIYPGIALTPLSSSIGRGSNSRPSDREPSALPLDHSFRFKLKSNIKQFLFITFTSEIFSSIKLRKRFHLEIFYSKDLPFHMINQIQFKKLDHPIADKTSYL